MKLGRRRTEGFCVAAGHHLQRRALNGARWAHYLLYSLVGHDAEVLFFRKLQFRLLRGATRKKYMHERQYNVIG